MIAMSIFNKRAIELEPYIVSKRYEGFNDDKWLFLDWNETTYELPMCVKDRLKEEIDKGLGVRYPDGDSDAVLKELEKFTGVDASSILVFNGADSALKDCIECLLDPGDALSIIEPEYSQINTYVQMASSVLDRLRFDNPFNLSIDKVLVELKGKKILYLSNPANPTGRYLPKNDIIKILDSGICLLLDEAYVEFALESCSDLVYKYENLFIFRTFSKAFGMAGLRFGYLLTHANNIDILRKNRNSKELNSFSQVAVVEALRNYSIYNLRIKEINEQRDLFIKNVNLINSRIQAYASMANFVVIKTADIGVLLKRLEENYILIRDRRGMYFMDDCARVSIGKPDEMSRVLKILTDFYIYLEV